MWKNEGMICGKRLWPKEENDTLVLLYGRMPHKDLVPHFSNRTLAAILQRARFLGLTRKTTGTTTVNKVKPLNLKGFNLGFAVAMLEGEGSIVLFEYKDRRGIMVGITWSNYSLKLLLKLKECLNGYGSIYHRLGTKEYTYSLNGVEKEPFLRIVEPFLISRKKKAQLALKYIEARRTNLLGSEALNREIDKIMLAYKNSKQEVQ